MLYLAEVKSQTRTFVTGGYKTEFRLLACQSSDQVWIPTNKGDFILNEGLNEQVSKGALYIINLGTNDQIQGAPELAGNRLVNYLKHFAKVIDQSKEQAEEIEQWKISLQMQGEEITNRQAELESQQEQLQAKELELAQLQEERDKLYEAQKQFREDQRQLEEVVSTEMRDLKIVKDSVKSLYNLTFDSVPLQENYQYILNLLNEQQYILDQYWQTLEHEKSQIPQQENDLNNWLEQINQKKIEVNSILDNLTQAKTDLEVKKYTIMSKEDFLLQVKINLEEIDNFREDVADLQDDSIDEDTFQKIDFNGLENMPLEDLENVINNLREETEKTVKFVDMQEEELTSQSDYVREIEAQLSQSNPSNKVELEDELMDAKEARKLLDRTLVGQRRNLKKQQKLFNQHLKILNKRKGINDSNNLIQIDLNPILKNIQFQVNNTQETKNKLELEINQLKQALQETEITVNNQTNDYQAKKQELDNENQQYLDARSNVIQMITRVNLLESQLYPMQENVNSIRDRLQTLEVDISNINNIASQHVQVMAEISHIINSD